jgi:hypothetical protein
MDFRLLRAKTKKDDPLFTEKSAFQIQDFHVMNAIPDHSATQAHFRFFNLLMRLHACPKLNRHAKITGEP